MGNCYHVAKNGSNQNSGSEKSPFLTIQKAADLAVAGDRVIVHEGTYREWVKPKNGGLHDGCRIIYEAGKGESVVIKGSEAVTGWEPLKEAPDVWRIALPNAMFGLFNPFTEIMDGDWMVAPRKYRVHLGDVYLNGASMYEAQSKEEVCHPQKRLKSVHETWNGREECLLNPEETLYQWYSETDETETVIYANFQGTDPNHALTEVNVRRSCFYPERTGLNYITVRGFEMAQAATPWAPPTADQPGLLGVNWSRGWVIENNKIHDSKCCGISLGKEASTGDNDYTKFGRKPGYQYQMEAVFRAAQIGWSKELTGSHIVRNNEIYDCGQTGIVGHLGCVFSEIYKNEIYRIAKKHEFYGHEIGGIKLHAAIDVQIHNNYIHHCSLGTWLDWQAQGTRVSANIYDQNNRDLMIEVTHGPCLVDQNIFTSPFSLVNAAEGSAFVQNLICGFMQHYPVIDRATPYHFPHTTKLLGTVPTHGGDDRFYQNVFVGGTEEKQNYGTADYNGSPVSMEEYLERVRSLGYGDSENYDKTKQPVYINGNIYFNGAKGFDRETESLIFKEDPKVCIHEAEDGVYLELTLPEKFFELEQPPVSTQTLGMTRLTEECFERPDGTSISFETEKDLTGITRAKHFAGPLEAFQPGANKIKIWER